MYEPISPMDIIPMLASGVAILNHEFHETENNKVNTDLFRNQYPAL